MRQNNRIFASFIKRQSGFFSKKEKIHGIITENMKVKELKIDQDYSESKFEIFLVSEDFNGLTILKRHKKVMDLLKSHGIMDEIHAVTLKLKNDPDK